MNASLISSAIVSSIARDPRLLLLGWTLLHSLWQGLLIAGAYAVVRALGASLAARTRYGLGLAALAAMLVLPASTYVAMAAAGARSLSLPSGLVPAGVWQRLLPSLVIVWMGGMAFSSLRLALGWRIATRLRNIGTLAVPDALAERFDDLLAKMRVAAPVRLLASTVVTAPVVTGWIRPIVLVPVAAIAGLPTAQLEALLAHELAHVLRRDYLVNLLQSAVEVVLFYHPATWWISEQVRAEREAACDDIAVEATGGVLPYVRALVDLESRRHAPALSARPRAAMGADGGSLKSRIRRLIEPADPMRSNGGGVAWVLGFAWLGVIGAATLYGASSFAPVVLQARVTTPAPPVIAALLFDPLFEPLPTPSTATIQGRVLADHSDAPVPSAEVQFFRAGSTMLAADIETDGEGRFAAPELDPGDYRLVISRPGYVGTDLRVVVATGATATVTPRVIRTGSISGQVLDAAGKPIVGATVHAFLKPRSGTSLARDYTTGHSATIGDRGDFRLFDLPPGDYAVAVTWGASTTAIGSAGAPVTAATYGSGFLFYPDNSSPRFYTISGGEEIRGLSFNVQSRALYSVSGQVRAPTPKTRYWLALSTVEQPALATAVAIASEDGTFKFSGVPAASYSLLAVQTGGSRNNLGAIPDPDTTYARVPLVVTAQDVADVSVSPEPGRSATLSMQAGARCNPSGRIVLNALEDWSANLQKTVGITAGKDEIVAALAPTRYSITATDLGECFLASSPILDLSAGNASVKLEVSVGGSIRGKIDEPDANRYAAVLVPAEFSSAASPDATPRVSTPSASGQFSFAGLRPGRYRLLAVDATDAHRRWMTGSDQGVEIEVRAGSSLETSIHPAAK